MIRRPANVRVVEVDARHAVNVSCRRGTVQCGVQRHVDGHAVGDDGGRCAGRANDDDVVCDCVALTGLEATRKPELGAATVVGPYPKRLVDLHQSVAQGGGGKIG